MSATRTIDHGPIDKMMTLPEPMAACTTLIRATLRGARSNEEMRAVYELQGVTVGEEALGSWRITVERVES